MSEQSHLNETNTRLLYTNCIYDTISTTITYIHTYVSHDKVSCDSPSCIPSSSVGLGVYEIVH